MEKHDDIRDLMEEVITKNLEFALDNEVGKEETQKAIEDGMKAYKAYTELTKVDDSHSEKKDELALAEARLELDKQKAEAEAARLKIEEEKIKVEEAKLKLEEAKLEHEKTKEANTIQIAKKNRVKELIVEGVKVVATTVIAPVIVGVVNAGLSKLWSNLEKEEVITNKGAQKSRIFL